MHLAIKALDGSICDINFGLPQTVWDLKVSLCNFPEFNIRPERMELLQNGKVLFNKDLLSECDLIENSIIVSASSGMIMESCTPSSKFYFTSSKKYIDNMDVVESGGDFPVKLSPTRSEILITKRDLQEIVNIVFDANDKQIQRKITVNSTASQTQEDGENKLLETVPEMKTQNTDIHIDIPLLRQFMALGFSRSEVKQALLMTGNDEDAACEYLIKYIISLPKPERIENHLLSLGDVSDIKKILQAEPEILIKFIVKMIDIHPSLQDGSIKKFKAEDLLNHIYSQYNYICRKPTNVAKARDSFTIITNMDLKDESSISDGLEALVCNAYAGRSESKLSSEKILLNIEEVVNTVKIDTDTENSGVVDTEEEMGACGSNSDTDKTTSSIEKEINVQQEQNTQEVVVNSFLVKDIASLGFKEEDIKNALSQCENKKGKSVEYLVDKIQSYLATLVPPDEQSKSKFDFLLQDEQFLTLRRVFHLYPYLLRKVLTRIIHANTKLRTIILNNEHEFANILCEDDYKGCKVDLYAISELTEKDIKFIRRLTVCGFPMYVVINVYLYHEKCESSTIEQLNSFIADIP